MSEHSEREVDRGKPDAREPYEPPKVEVLGTVRELTEGTATPGADIAVEGSVTPSDRNLKERFAPVDIHAVLNRAAALPLSSWSYKADPDVRHIGPMAQDFHAAFGMGDDERRINMVDAFGVLLGCVQALRAQLQERDAQISALWAELEALKEQPGVGLLD